MGSVCSYASAGGVATVTMDDGKVNVLSQQMLSELSAALDRAEAEGVAVVLSGREGVFSAGFDLTVLRAGGPAALSMLRAGFGLATRLLTFPAPVLAVCNGHAIAMGVFLLLSVDQRIGVNGPYRITAHEVAIGVTMPRAAVHLCKDRLSPAQFAQAVTLAEVYSPRQAAAAGFLDLVVEADDLDPAVAAASERLGRLDRAAHVATKLRARQSLAETVRAAIDAEFPLPSAA